MTNGADWQQHQGILEHQQYLLTQEAFHEWVFSHSIREFGFKLKNSGYKSMREIYLKEHGLPLDSVIEGL